MKRIALALAVVAMAGCSKGGDSSNTATPGTMNAAPDTMKSMTDTSHMMMSDSARMPKATDSTSATKTKTTMPSTPKKKRKS